MKIPAVRHIHYESGPNMTPLVDVVLVILIFLMLVGKFGERDHYLSSTLPLAGTGPGATTRPDHKITRIDLRLDSPTPGSFHVSYGKDIHADDAETLYRQLVALKSQLELTGTPNADVQLRISPTKRVPFRYVVLVQEAAMRAKFEHVGFTTAR